MDNTNNRIPDYNIEDTGKLMTMSLRGSRTRKIVLIAISVILVAALATGGFLLLNNKRYNDSIAIADKAFAEGNYELAESEYLKAVSINKRKPRAREGLAYTYAIQGKKDDAKKTYQELKVDFGDPKYDEAIVLIDKGEKPTNPDLIPAVGLWRNSSADSLPYQNDLREYLWAIHFNCFYIDGQTSFDCKDPSGFLALYTMLEDPYMFTLSIEERQDESSDKMSPEWVTDWSEGDDPRGWVKLDDDLTMGYVSADAAKADEMVKAIFNVDDKRIEEDLELGETNKDLYKEGDRYYCMVYGGGGAADYVFKIADTWTDGQKYCFKYDAGWEDYEYDDGRIDMEEDHCTYYIIVEPKLIDGKHYWSLYYLGTEMPKDVTDGLAYTYGNDKKDGDDANGGAKAYQPVIDEYKQVLAEAANGKEYDIYGSGNPNGFTYVFSEMIPNEQNDNRQPLYAIKDINGDGVAEMVVGAEAEGEYYVGSILTLDGSGAPLGVINCGSFMYRGDMKVFEDGRIMYGGSSGANSHGYTIYTLKGTALNTTDDFSAEDGKYLYNGESMNQADWERTLDDKLKGADMTFDWKSF